MSKFLPLLLLFILSCGENEELPPLPEDPDLEFRSINGPAIATPYALEVPDYFPTPIIDPDNPLTEEGVELGRRLFYDPILSGDSTFSCASCHKQEFAFTDGLAKAVGTRGEAGERSAMSLVNLAFNPNGFHWDGRFDRLWQQALHPVENMLEMDGDWEEVLRRIRLHDDYPRRLRHVFAIERTDEITREMIAKAIAQFEATLISGNSRFDQAFYTKEAFFTEEEQLGADSLFFIEDVPVSVLHPGCGHCHNAPSFGDNKFKNNGIEDVADLDNFPDKGLGRVTGNRFDNGKFRTPTLRNIARTAPYMHDGRFATLEEVLDHYASGGHGVENEDPNITGFDLSVREKRALIAFLKSLTDEDFLGNPRFSSPF